MKPATRGNLLLLLTAAVWGAAFVAQRAGMDAMEPVSFNGLRTLLGAAALTPVALLRRRALRRRGDPVLAAESPKTTWFGGIALGLLLFTAATLQQIGMVTTESGKAGFLTALYILLVPLFGFFSGHRPRPLHVACALVGALGLRFLSMPAGGFGPLSRGDALLVGCAAFFSFHILLVDRIVARTEPLTLAVIQFWVVGLVSLPVIAAFEHPTWAALRATAVPFLYAALASTALGYTLQICGQRDAPPAAASLIMSLESAFALLSGVLILGERPTARELIGCGILFAAILFSQLPPRRAKT